MRESFTNFATTALSAAISTTTALSFNVTTSQGALFPQSNFYVVIETEILLISSRSVDAFTVGQRGADGTLAAIHGSGVTVQLSWNRYDVNHLWQNLGDTYHPEVPPLHLGSTPSIYDNEFESTGAWTLAPSPAGGTTFSVGSSVVSHLVLNRGMNDNSTYTAYVPFVQTVPFTVTCKLNDATSFLHTLTSDQAQCHFFVSDQSTPSAGPDTGTRFRVDTITSGATVYSGSNPMRWVRAATDTTGTFAQLGPIVPIAPGTPLFLRLTYDGSGNWAGFFGDGYVYWQLATKAGFLTAPQSLGITFYNYTPSNTWMPHTALIDYVRVVVGSVLPPYAN